MFVWVRNLKKIILCASFNSVTQYSEGFSLPRYPQANIIAVAVILMGSVSS